MERSVWEGKSCLDVPGKAQDELQLQPPAACATVCLIIIAKHHRGAVVGLTRPINILIKNQLNENFTPSSTPIVIWNITPKSQAPQTTRLEGMSSLL